MSERAREFEEWWRRPKEVGGERRNPEEVGKEQKRTKDGWDLRTLEGAAEIRRRLEKDG